MTYTYKRDENGLFICPHCPEKKKNQNTMHYHLKRHDGDLPFECATCKKKFQFQRTLDIHRAAKHKESAEAKTAVFYKCPIDGCQFQTLTQGNRIIHYVRKHCKAEVDKILAEENLGCKVCKKEFQSNTAFYYHASDCIAINDTQRYKFLMQII